MLKIYYGIILMIALVVPPFAMFTVAALNHNEWYEVPLDILGLVYFVSLSNAVKYYYSNNKGE